ncbi:TetR/AcrR family transcriptional regulator [Arenibaculum sp.]|uniref:TetR/AcrR family transcriptional regulator n=1 Tax=Arenibaculum sp. TaxID=2865862 RepID=UPI002E104528|nr:TetR family transcriptional regulator [Arenibaculum sp.]
MAGKTRNEPPDTRERIVEATWKLMEESRDLQVRIADIAQAAGVSRQAVYLHFGNRANLLLAAVQHRDRTSPTGAIARAALKDPVPGALGTYVEAWFAHIPRIQPVAQMLSAASLTDPEARVAWEDRMALLRRLTTALAGRLAAAGLLAPGWTAERAADWIWHRTHLDGWCHLVADRGWDPADAARQVRLSLERDLLRVG